MKTHCFPPCSPNNRRALLQYRRHCLATLVPSSETIAHSIDAALDQGEYHPFRTCALVQECTGDSDPMKFDDIDLDDLEGSGLDLFFDID